MASPKITASVNCQVQGYFRMTAVQGDGDGNPIPGTERELCDWTPNLLTDNGLEMLKSTGFLATIAVGSGSTAPDKTDTALNTLVASASTSIADGPNDLTVADYPWTSVTATATFAKGAAAGNLSEMGVGKTATNLLARALIKDSGGNPTTITVLPIEILTVTYQWRVYFDFTSSHNDSFTINGVTYTTTTMMGYIGTSSAQYWNSSGLTNYAGFGVYTGDLGAPGSSPANKANKYGTTTKNFSFGDVGDSFVDCAITADASGNSVDISAVEVNFTADFSYNNTWQISVKSGISPPLPKDDTNEFSITIRFDWARKVS